MAEKRELQIFRDGRRYDSYLTEPLLEGEQGNMQTLEAMKKICLEDRLQPDLRTFVLREVIRGVPGHDFIGELDSIHRFAQKQITYRQDPWGVERVADIWSTMYGLRPSVEGQLYEPEGDCGIKSTFIASCAAILGYKPFFVVIKQREQSPAFDHVFNAVVLPDGSYRYYDATPQDAPPGWKAGSLIERWFPILD